MRKRVLFVSNGHGEDLNASAILAALLSLCPELQVSALPIVGEGKSYRRLGVPIIAPTLSLPSGGFLYMGYDQLWRDVRSGLLPLLWQQMAALYRFRGDFVVAVGDVVVILAALLTGCPFAVFLVSSSAFYEGQLRLPWLAQWGLGHPRCEIVFTRDHCSALDLQRQGLGKAEFHGYPIMDFLEGGQELQLDSSLPIVALLPGSRLPECGYNLALQLEVIEILQQEVGFPVQGWAALVPALAENLSSFVTPIGWSIPAPGVLGKGEVKVYYSSTAFAQILHQCQIVLGMAGTAVEQAVGLGKPVIQIPGRGPQFNYRFAEAQNRLLGLSVRTIGTEPATKETLRQAARAIPEILQDREYLQACQRNGKARV
ncbi:MAG: lipid-A-disaccharide synthase-related protein, partial [Pseudanabaenaceae cyanobacterium]